MIPAARFRTQWLARPWYYTRRLWALLIVLDTLPWPWGEDILAFLFLVVAIIRPSRRRRAVAWASAQRRDRRWRLAAAVCAFRGRWVARWRLLGFRSPDELRPYIVLEGEERMTAVNGGAILLEFHLGPPTVELPLAVLGHQVQHVGWHDHAATAGWWREAWRPIVASSPLASVAYDWRRWPAVLYTARQTLLEGRKICIMADGYSKRELFRVPLPGGPMVVGAGWLTLHQLTGAPVLPVLTHLEGRTQVVAIHRPLPVSEPDPARRLEVWRAMVASLVADYVQRFPEQCPSMALPSSPTTG